MAPADDSNPQAGASHQVLKAVERRARLRRALSLREWARLPAPLLIALAIHGGLGFWLWTQIVELDPPEVALVARVSADDADELLVPEPEVEPIELIEPEDVEIEPVITESLEPSDNLDDVVDMLGLGNSGLGGGGGGAGVRPASAGSDVVSAGPSPFGDFVDDLRRRGVEVCFVIDATGSMQRFIDRARETIDRIVGDLATVVPDTRIAVVAYRDLKDSWVTRRTELTTNRYLVHNFLLDLEASGGKRDYADFEEAVEVGLAVATTELAWREDARRVIILVGDAPYHEEDRGEAMAVVREFVRDDHSLVNTVYVGLPGDGRTSDGARAALEAFERIAKTGHGHSFTLALMRDTAPSALGGYRIEHGGSAAAEEVEDPEIALLRRQVLDATFGPEWREQIDTLLAAEPNDGKRSMARRREGRGDTEWFARQLLQQRLHPAIIDGSRRLFDARIAVASLMVLEDSKAAEPMRAAVLNVLKTSLADFAGLPFDVSQPITGEEQRRLLAVIRNRVMKMAGAPAILAELRPPAASRSPAIPPPPPGAQR